MKRSTFTLICLAVLAASACQTRAAAVRPAYPEDRPWTARWIWRDGEANPGNFYLYLRKTFDATDDVAAAVARATADSRYLLFVNGRRVGRGPVKSDPRWLYYDEWDIGPHLKRGQNAIAVLVHCYGEWTFSYRTGRGGFLFEADVTMKDGRKERWASDKTWKTLPGSAWRRDLSRMSIQQGFPEIFDARKEPAGWKETGFNDADWAGAAELGGPPVEPWPRLVPRSTPDPFEEVVRPAAALQQGTAELPFRYARGVDFNGHFAGRDAAVAYAFSWLKLSKPGEATVSLAGGAACKLTQGKRVLLSNYLGPGIKLDVPPSIALNMDGDWTPMLLKCVRQGGRWDADVRVKSGAGTDVVFSPERDPSKPGWAIVGAFGTSGDVQKEFNRSHGPDKNPRPAETYRTADGRDAGWRTVEFEESESQGLAAALAGLEFHERADGPILNATSIPSPADGAAPMEIRPTSDRAAYILFDFGREVSGHPMIEVESAEGGEIVDLGYSETLENEDGAPLSPLRPEGGRIDPSRGGVNYADRYIARPGRQTWETFEKRAFRYALVVFRNVNAPLKVRFLGLRFSTYDVGNRGSFSSSDGSLDAIWKTGAYTLQLNMDDSYTDCPWRERGQWWGDARVEALVNYYAFGDAELARRGVLQIGESQREDGLVAGIYPTDWDNRWLPDYALIWILSVMDYYRFTGDSSPLPEILPRFQKMLDGFFASHENADGLLENVPHWVFIDWAPVDKRGAVAALNAYYYGALRDAASLFRTGGDGELAAKYEKKAAVLKEAFNETFWNEARGFYADCFAEGAACPGGSQHANALAVLFDLAPADKARSIMRTVLDPGSGLVQVGSPYFSHYILSALRRAGEDEAADTYVKRWKTMLDWGATTWWEEWKPGHSFAHAWSSAPTYDLSRHVLGVWPSAPGYAEVLVEPRPGGLKTAGGTVPTPHGDIRVTWTRSEGPREFRMILELPSDLPTEVRLPVDGFSTAPLLRIDGSTLLPDGARLLSVSEGRMNVRLTGKTRYELSLREK